ncbi:MAG: methyl-accepting chemotaxis protein [Verrucomicrobiota bacterium]
MKNWSVQKRVMFGFALVILISAIICTYAILRLGTIQTYALQVQMNTVPSLHGIGEMNAAGDEDFIRVLEYIYSTNAVEKATLDTPLNAFSEEMAKRFKALEPTLLDAKDQQMFGTIKTARDEYTTARNKVLELARANKSAEAEDCLDKQLKPKYRDFSKAIDEIANDNFTDGILIGKEITASVSSTRWVVLGGSLASLVVCILIAMSVVKSLSETLNKLLAALMQVNTSSAEMAATLKEQQASANEVASTSMEIGATAKEISATARELGKTMNEVAHVSEQTAQVAGGGQTGLARLESTMRQIMDAAGTISAKLAILNEKTANINSVVTTINKVADQTNLLSLNAAIEAEKAGEHGQGFAVVATEIRRLADQTAVATYDIEQMVKEMQSAVAAGVMGMDKFNEEVRRGADEVGRGTAQLTQIIQQVQTLTPRFETVNDGMQSQSTAASQISDALGQLGETAQQSAQALRQNTEALEQLTAAARGLHEASAQFKN